jgi:hypothetical protein
LLLLLWPTVLSGCLLLLLWHAALSPSLLQSRLRSLSLLLLLLLLLIAPCQSLTALH